MKRYLCVFKLVVILTISFSAFASEEKNEVGQPRKLFMHYKPPVGEDMHFNREGGETRGGVDGDIYLAALVPNHIALTSNNQPSLYWYISTRLSKAIVFTVNSEASFKPVLEMKLSKPDKNGIQCFRFSDYNIKLSSGINYEWSITMVLDVDQRSKDVSAMGMIKCLYPSERLNAELSKANERDVPVIYAMEGLWYDALSAISKLIDANPDDGSLSNERLFLLEQVGLQKIVDYEKKKM